MSESEKSVANAGAGMKNWASRATAILAVLAALSSGRWGASNLQAILEQGKVNDSWSYYQAKSVKQRGLEETRDLARAVGTGETGEKAAALDQLVKRLDAEAAREDREKGEEKTRAGEMEAKRNRLVESSFWLEISFACLQLGVILCTIAAGTAFRPALPIGLAVGVIGLLLMVNGFHPFVHAPESWYHGSTEQMDYTPAPHHAKGS